MRLSLLKWIILPLLAAAARGACVQPAVDLQKATPSPVKKRPLLTLPDVFALVLERNPDLAVYGADVRIQAARVIQAGLRPNPELQTEVENIGGTGELGIINSAETILQLSQRFEVGGKRRLRIQSAEKERDLAARTLLVQQAGLLALGAEFFIDTLAAQQRLVNREQLFDLAQKIHVTVSAPIFLGWLSVSASRSNAESTSSLPARGHRSSSYCSVMTSRS